ncbi:amidohydrolase family protein, partial [Streptomyces cinereoruber]|uniref:amidohydrolase family protein n=1 Tax=Streptomyces cinereoruber TaxID=67260 RepID=UPI0036B8197E
MVPAREGRRAVRAAEALTVDEALHAYTVAGAHACHWEDTLGSLTPGKRADLVADLADGLQERQGL